jgi:hypothetical protein
MRLKLSMLLAALTVTLVSPAPAQAQFSSSETSAIMSAELLESLSIVVLPGLVNFSLSGGSATNAGSTPLVVTTTWALGLSRSSVKVYAYFSNASAALSHTVPGNTVDIPASRVQVSLNGGAMRALDQTVTFGGGSAGLQLFSQGITVLNIGGVRADTLTFNIDLSGYMLPVDVYTGTLRLRAQATP